MEPNPTREFELELEISMTKERLRKLKGSFETEQYNAVITGESSRIEKIEEEIKKSESLLGIQEKALGDLKQIRERAEEMEQREREAAANWRATVPGIIERLEAWYDEYEAIERDHQALINSIPPKLKGNLHTWYVLPAKVQPRNEWHLWVLRPKGLEPKR